MSHAAHPSVWMPMKLDIFLQNLKYTLRTLGRDRGFTLVAVLILALAIGANIGVFSVVNTLLLRPLPFPESHQLVWIAPPPTSCGLSCATYSADAYEEFRDQSRAYQDVTGYMAFTHSRQSAPHRPRRARAGYQHRSHWQLLPGSRRAASNGPSVHPGRGSRRAASGCSAGQCLLAASVRL